MVKSTKGSASKSGATTEKKSNKRKRKNRAISLPSLTEFVPSFREGDLFHLHLQSLETSKSSSAQRLKAQTSVRSGSSRHGYFQQGHVDYEQFRERYFR